MFFYMCIAECMCICHNVFINLCYYMHANLTRENERDRERERKKNVVGQIKCLEECCYFSPRSNNFISRKQILIFSVVKLMFCP